MGYVRLKPERRLNLDMARMFGPPATRRKALVIQARAKALADAKAIRSSVADDIDVSVHAHGSHTAVILSVKGRNGVEIASALEFGYFNEWLEHKYGIHSALAWMPGLHIMAEAKYA